MSSQNFKTKSPVRTQATEMGTQSAGINHEQGNTRMKAKISLSSTSPSSFLAPK